MFHFQELEESTFMNLAYKSGKFTVKKNMEGCQNIQKAVWGSLSVSERGTHFASKGKKGKTTYQDSVMPRNILCSS